MTERNIQPSVESVRLETITAINNIIDLKFNNVDVVREDPDHGAFVLDDVSQDGHNGNTVIEITNYNDGRLIRFIERFSEVTPRHKPSVLGYNYDLYLTEEHKLVLSVGKDYTDIGLLAKRRLEDLKSSGISLPSEDDDELQYVPSELQAQKVLVSLQKMKIFIKR